MKCQTSTRDWTVLVYQGNGNHGKSGTHFLDLKELEAVANQDRVSFIAQSHTHYREEKLARREIKPTVGFYPAPPIQIVPGRQAQKQVLSDFVEWGMKSYPARRYGLVLSGYSGGYTGALADARLGLMPLGEIRDGLESGLGGRKLDVLAFDGNWMASVEVATEFQDLAKCMFASQNRRNSWRYDESFAQLVRQPGLNGMGLASALAEADNEDSGPTVYDLSKVTEVVSSTKDLCQVLSEQIFIENPLDRAESVDHFKDFVSVSAELQGSSFPRPVQEAASQLSTALGYLVVAHKPREDHNSLGVNVSPFFESGFADLKFNKLTGWDQAVKSFTRSWDQDD